MAADTKQARDQRHDARRRALKPWRSLYNTKRWQVMRLQQLSKQPLCERCQTNGKVAAATVVHHVDKHEGDPAKFFLCSNLASSCKSCHDAVEQQVEQNGYFRAVGNDGWPLDANHPFNSK